MNKKFCVMIAAIITAISCVFGFAACVPEQEKPTQGIPKGRPKV